MGASKYPILLPLSLSLNLVFFTLVTSTFLPDCTSDPPQERCGYHQPGTGYPGTGSPGTGFPGTRSPGAGSPGTGFPGTGAPGTGSPGTGNPGMGSPGKGHPGSSSPCPPKRITPVVTYKHPKCPRDALKLGMCADLLGDLVHLVIGAPPVTPCCALIQGLANLEAAVCLCTAIKLNVLGIRLGVPVSLSLLLNNCGKNVPRGFQC